MNTEDVIKELEKGVYEIINVTKWPSMEGTFIRCLKPLIIEEIRGFPTAGSIMIEITLDGDPHFFSTLCSRTRLFQRN